jgi:type I restriction enzyme S subunit
MMSEERHLARIGTSFSSPPGEAVVRKPLGEVSSIDSGVTIGRKLQGSTALVPYLRVANVQAGHLNLIELRTTPASAEEVSRYRLQKDDVLMTEGGDPDKLGRGALWDGAVDPCIHQNHVFRVRLATDVVLPRYFVRYLASAPAIQYFLRAAKQTTGIATINKSQLRALPVPLPPLPEQSRIADILDKADGVRRKRKEAIALADELVRSAFLEIFGDPVTNPKGWGVKTMGELADTASGVAKGKRYEGQPLVTLPYMRVANVQDGHLALDDVKTITVSEEEGRRYLLRVGDVLLTEGGDPDKLGRGAVWRGEVAECIHQNHIFRVRPGQEVRSDYLSAIIGSERGKRYFLRAAKQTTGIASINMTQLKAFPVLLPPVELQDAYGSLVKQAATARAALQSRGELVETLFDSLVARAFSGSMEAPC